MKKISLLCGLLLVVTASMASAGGVNLRWTACFGDAGAANKTFACNTNSGANQAFGSFQLDADQLGSSGLEVVIDIASAGSTLPAWWQLKNVGTCRPTAQNWTPAFASGVACADWGAGQAAGGIGAYNIGQRGPNTARVVSATAVPLANLTDLAAGQEYFAFIFQVNNSKTVGPVACGGCQVGVCLVFNSINVVTTDPLKHTLLTTASNGTDSNFCTWQGGGNPTVGQITGCPAATGTTNKTWGQVKSLYR